MMTKKEKEQYEKQTKKLKKLSQKLPKRAIFTDYGNDVWNCVPLGIALNDKKKKSIMGWWLNDQNYDKVCGYFDKAIPSTSLLISGGTGSGKSVVEGGIIEHINKFRSKFQLVGVDCKRVEFLRKADKMNGVITDVWGTAEAVDIIQNIMMQRFTFMQKQQVNTLYKLDPSKIEVDYYRVAGMGEYQFDEIMSVELPIDTADVRRYERYKNIYMAETRPTIRTIESIYNDLKNETYKKLMVNGKPITLKDIKPFKGKYAPKAVILMIDELAEVMCSDDYKSVDIIKKGLGSIAMWGRASGVHLVLACQRASGSVISSDLMNNLQMRILLGCFDDGASMLVFDKDVSDLCTPGIKGRGFVSTGRLIVETQMFIGGVNYYI